MAGLELEFILEQLKITKEFNFSEVNCLRSQFEKCANPDFLSLEKQRLQGSNTLVKQKDIELWKEVNRIIFQWIEFDEQLSFYHIVNINKLLDKNGAGKFREVPIFAGLGEFIDSKLLNQFEKLFIENVLQIETNPIYKASQVYQWIVTFHPFNDANGRTARLIADFVLMSAGYVPLSFENPFDAMLAVKSNTSDIDGNYAVAKTIKGIKNSYKILML